MHSRQDFNGKNSLFEEALVSKCDKLFEDSVSKHFLMEERFQTSENLSDRMRDVLQPNLNSHKKRVQICKVTDTLKKKEIRKQ